MATENWRKFSLIMWKHYVQQKRKILRNAWTITKPFLLVVLVVLSYENTVNSTQYHTFAYSPENPVFNAIMDDVSASLTWNGLVGVSAREEIQEFMSIIEFHHPAVCDHSKIRSFSLITCQMLHFRKPEYHRIAEEFVLHDSFAWIRFFWSKISCSTRRHHQSLYQIDIKQRNNTECGSARSGYVILFRNLQHICNFWVRELLFLYSSWYCDRKREAVTGDNENYGIVVLDALDFVVPKDHNSNVDFSISHSSIACGTFFSSQRRLIKI